MAGRSGFLFFIFQMVFLGSWLLQVQLAMAECARPGLLRTTSELYHHDLRTAVAMGGYDPVSYHVDGKPRPGKERFTVVWCGVVWLFANQGNREVFRRDPLVYAPDLGGYGAMAAARGRLTPGNPLIWTLHDGKLYFFYSQANRYVWLQNEERHRDLATEGWSRLRRLLVH